MQRYYEKEKSHKAHRAYLEKSKKRETNRSAFIQEPDKLNENIEGKLQKCNIFLINVQLIK